MDVHRAADIDAKDIERAQATWSKFTQFMKWSVIGTVAVLALMGLIFIDW
jgi:hypothetical protein